MAIGSLSLYGMKWIAVYVMIMSVYVATNIIGIREGQGKGPKPRMRLLFH